ncbi:DUF4278 domain-containing protein [Aliterella atlantica]|uniref:DUF4278 domain-containing protein n=1 Tax=Aliterella atlantica CENA595 TaxID=1618023 RepID=A0A0D8ZPN7_9CYAN|nr:DUF4278 domain-containing protein [Aliterella atlantica]KJH70680.1 hypothetical protein UH38_16600 [Aliterella atlantica CENA595]
MKLTYRGVAYEANNPVLELTQGEVSGKYRGAHWKPKYVKHIPVPPLAVELKYRGNSYSLGDPIDVEANLLPKRFKVQITQEQVQAPIQLPAHEVTSTHLANIRNNLERRLQVAIEKGDEDLIRLLQIEARELI